MKRVIFTECQHGEYTAAKQLGFVAVLFEVWDIFGFFGFVKGCYKAADFYGLAFVKRFVHLFRVVGCGLQYKTASSVGTKYGKYRVFAVSSRVYHARRCKVRLGVSAAKPRFAE